MKTSWVLVWAATACGGSSRVTLEGSAGNGAAEAEVTGGTSGTSGPNDTGGAQSAGTAGRANGAGRGGSANGAGRGGTANGGTANGARAGTSETGGDTSGGGGTPDTRCITDADSLDSLSFNLTIVSDALVDATVVVHFSRAPDGTLSALFGSPGQAYREPTTIRETAAYGEDVGFDRDFTLFERGDVPRTIVSIETLDLCVQRGASLSLVGDGMLLLDQQYDDSTDESFNTFTLTGTLDDVPPQWVLNPATVDPLSLPLFVPTEPLALGAAISIDSGTDEPTALEPVEQEQTIVAFRVPVILPLGLSGVPSGTATDLAGLGLENARGHYTTVLDPGLQPLDGFESTLVGATLATTTLEDDDAVPELVSGESAITGAQSLRVPAGLRVLLHLARPDGSTRLSFDYRTTNDSWRPTSEGDPPTSGVEDPLLTVGIRVGVIGGSTVLTRSLRADGFTPSPGTGGEGAGGAGTPGAGGEGAVEPGAGHVVFDLSETGPDVLLGIDTPYKETLVLDAASIVIDSLAFE